MIGATRLQAIARKATAEGCFNRCRGLFVLAAQQELYGSGIVNLSVAELQEVMDFLGSAQPAEDSAPRWSGTAT